MLFSLLSEQGDARWGSSRMGAEPLPGAAPAAPADPIASRGLTWISVMYILKLLASFPCCLQEGMFVKQPAPEH